MNEIRLFVKILVSSRRQASNAILLHNGPLLLYLVCKMYRHPKFPRSPLSEYMFGSSSIDQARKPLES